MENVFFKGASIDTRTTGEGFPPMSEWHIELTPYSTAVFSLAILGAVLAFALNLYQAGILLFAVSGTMISYHLYQEKKEEESKVVCPIGRDCVRVITSKYSEFLGFSVEVLGAIYYGFIVLGYFALLLPWFTAPSWFLYLLLFASALAVLFSLYLIYIQAVPLGMWCVWCVTSAILCTLILTGAVTRLGSDVFTILGQFEVVAHSLYLLAVAAGFGTALASDALTLRFLETFKISEGEADVLKTLLELTWGAFGIILLAGVFWIAPNYQTMLTNPAAQVSIIAFIILVVNAAVLYFYVSDRIVDIHFWMRDETDPEQEETRRHIEQKDVTRRLAFALAPVSIVSWAAMLLFTFITPLATLPFDILFALYLFALAAAILTGLLIEKIMELHATGKLDRFLDLVG